MTCQLKHSENEIMKHALIRIANHEYRSDRRHRGMTDETEVNYLMRTALLALRKLMEVE